jgi:hypothetical protein
MMSLGLELHVVLEYYVVAHGRSLKLSADMYSQMFKYGTRTFFPFRRTSTSVLDELLLEFT